MPGMEKWQKVSEEPLWNGFRKISGATFIMPNGRHKTFELLPGGRSACIVALTPGRQVLLVREFRPGMEEVLLEIPGGIIGPDEDPVAAAARELLEETGYAGDLVLVGTHFVDAYSGHVKYSFVATDCRKVGEPAPEQAEGEWIELETLTLAGFRNHLRSGLLTDTATGYRGLDYLGLL